jgi:hypothetical protein
MAPTVCLYAGESPTVTLSDIAPLLQRLQLQDSEDDNTVQVIYTIASMRVCLRTFLHVISPVHCIIFASSEYVDSSAIIRFHFGARVLVVTLGGDFCRCLDGFVAHEAVVSCTGHQRLLHASI